MNEVQKNYVKTRIIGTLIALAVIGVAVSAFLWYWVAVGVFSIIGILLASVMIIEIVNHYRYKWRILAVTEPDEEDYFDQFFYRVKHDLIMYLDEDSLTPEEKTYIEKISKIKKPALL